MKNQFTVAELAIFDKLISDRLNYIANSGRFKQDLKIIQSTLDRVILKETFGYKRNEKKLFISCVNESIFKLKERLNLPTAFSWLTISPEQLNIVTELDLYKSILFKCGYYDDKNIDKKFRYDNILK
ncbi:MAG: hypothetical protein EOP53_11240, partial [Sphingobacteriales bacterium]